MPQMGGRMIQRRSTQPHSPTLTLEQSPLTLLPFGYTGTSIMHDVIMDSQPPAKKRGSLAPVYMRNRAPLGGHKPRGWGPSVWAPNMPCFLVLILQLRTWGRGRRRGCVRGEKCTHGSQRVTFGSAPEPKVRSRWERKRGDAR